MPSTGISTNTALQHRPILYDRILVDDNDPIMDRVHCKVPFLSGNIIDTDTATITDSSILVYDSLADDSSLSDAYIGDTLLSILPLLFLCLVEGGSHAVDTIQGGTGFDQGAYTDD